MILASQSPRRLELLHAVGIEPRVVVPSIDETPFEGESPETLVGRLSLTKALAVVDQAAAGEPCVAADTVVWLDGDILGKPRDRTEAKAMVQGLSARTHHVSTGVSIAWRTAEGILEHDTFVDTTAVTFYPITPDQAATYAASGEGLDKAGAYGIQGLGRLLVEKIDGNYDTVVGLPVARLLRRLGELGLAGR